MRFISESTRCPISQSNGCVQLFTHMQLAIFNQVFITLQASIEQKNVARRKSAFVLTRRAPCLPALIFQLFSPTCILFRVHFSWHGMFGNKNLLWMSLKTSIPPFTRAPMLHHYQPERNTLPTFSRLEVLTVYIYRIYLVYNILLLVIIMSKPAI